ncbi:hypothetical protein Tco_1136702 [Tanacetum coccineum]
MAGVDVDTLTMEQYLALSRENQAPGVVKPEIGGNVNFEIKSQFMRKLREDTFSGNKNENAHDHIDRVLSIVGLFNIPEVSKDAVMLRVFPFTLTRLRNYQYLGSPQKGIYLKRPIPGMTPAQALTAIQTVVDHSQKWHDGTTSRNIRSSSNNDGLAALVGCQIFEGPHLDKDCPLNEEVKQVKEVRYGEFGRTIPFNGNNGGKFRVGPPETILRLIIVYHMIKTLQENTEINTRNQSSSLKNLETQIEQLTKEIHLNKTPNLSSGQIKIITANQETSMLNKLYGVSFISENENDTRDALQHQLSPKELNPGSFTLSRTIGKFNFYAMADLDMSKEAPLGIVENILVKIDKFIFPSQKYQRLLAVDKQARDRGGRRRPRTQRAVHAEDYYDYKWEFNLEIDKLADEYELGIGKKGHILDNIWEYCN